MKLHSYKYIVGIDEVGRGPLAGPVTLCAFVVKTSSLKTIHKKLAGITDSKLLKSKKREEYYKIIRTLQKEGEDIDFKLCHVSASVIDQKGIMFALNLALTRSLEKLNLDPKDCYLYLDGGLRAPAVYAQETVIKGDQKIWQISAASVIAKVLRDRKMVKYDAKYPDYGFAQHKGYGTRSHLEQITKKGVTVIHRKTWISS